MVSLILSKDAPYRVDATALVVGNLGEFAAGIGER